MTTERTRVVGVGGVREAEDWLAIADGLAVLANIQRRGAADLPEHLLGYDDADFRTAALGAFVELGELVNECQWKPWRSYTPPTEAGLQRILEEFGDVLHFLAWLVNNLEQRFGLTPVDFTQGFLDVAAENRRRFNGQVPGREPPSTP